MTTHSARSLQPDALAIEGNALTIEDVDDVARGHREVRLSAAAVQRVRAGRVRLEQVLQQRPVLYGVTTGVGQLGNMAIAADEVGRLQVNILRSHATGTGPAAEVDLVRAMLLLRANTLAIGVSAIRPPPLELLLGMLNRGVHPVVPTQGSVGASGDLAPLSHAALVVIGEGRAEFAGKEYDGATALQLAGLHPAELRAKEALALNNGTQFTTALAVLSALDLRRLLSAALAAAALTLEALEGITDSLDARVHQLRPHPGAIAVAACLRHGLRGSTRVRPSASIQPGEARGPQDHYSLRALPPVLGTAVSAMWQLEDTVSTEINAATDDPLFVDGDDGSVALYCCNFHAQPVSAALDHAAVGAATAASIAERRIAIMVDAHHSRGLPPFLVHPEASVGVNTGLMIAHVTAAALVSENKGLCHPASVDSIPTSANLEDFVSMGPIAGRKARQVIANAEIVVAIELLCAAQAIDIRGDLEGLSEAARMIYEHVRAVSPTIVEDRVFAEDINAITQLVRSGVLAHVLPTLQRPV